MTINNNLSSKKHLTKPQLLKHISKNTKLPASTINLVLTELIYTIKDHIKNDSPGKFILPGIFKLTTKILPAQKEKLGINPFTKKQMLFKAKPITKKINIKVLKKLKDMVNNKITNKR